ncbi:carbohydrate ABC transporter permease [Streptomyces sp. NPDC059866]|uniref:carbohydrate ABC transporter permease n=1 Tax=Streptomyces sp. NPDC059866 TaxID=3346978 RepID=UPI00365DFF0C
MTAPTPSVTPRHPRRRPWWKTALGVFLTAVMLFPVYWIFNVSLTRTEDMRSDPPHWFPWDPTLEGYANVVRDQLPALTTSLGVGLGCVLLTLAISAPAAFSLAKLRPRGAGTVNFLLLVAQMVPSVVMAVGFYAIYVRLGWLNSVWGLIIADSTIAVPFGVMVLTAFMSGIPGELLQAAKIDGANTWRIFRSVILPLSRNAVLTVSLFAFLWAWSDFVFASTLDRNGDAIPITLGIYAYIGNNTTEWNSIMATAAVASVPAAVLLVVAQRFVAGGVTAGAVKD